MANANPVGAQAGAGESLDQTLAHLRQLFFDSKHQPIVAHKFPEPGVDILASSANNLYQGVSMKDLDVFTERYPLDSILVKQEDGKLAQKVCRIGENFGTLLRRVVPHLRVSRAFAPEPTVQALDALITFYNTGETEDRRAADIAWVEDENATVDPINGFIEVYLNA